MGLFTKKVIPPSSTEASSLPRDEMADLADLQRRLLGFNEASNDGIRPSLVSRTRIGDYDFVAHLVPAKLISSAGFDFIPHADGGGAFFIYKASGLGVIPAFMGHEASARFRERFSSPSVTTAGLTAFTMGLNDTMAERFGMGRFLMCSIGTVSSVNGITWLSAGGPLLFIYRKRLGTCKQVNVPSSVVLGQIPSEYLELSSPFKLYKISLEPGDSAFFVQDGEWDEATIAPAIINAFQGGNRPASKTAEPNPSVDSQAREIVETIMAAMKDDVSDDKQPLSGNVRPRNDRYIVMIECSEFTDSLNKGNHGGTEEHGEDGIMKKKE